MSEQYQLLGFDQLKDEIFTTLCIARIVEPTSKLDSLRVLAEFVFDTKSREVKFTASWYTTDSDTNFSEKQL
jgi:hypothetical protein